MRSQLLVNLAIIFACIALTGCSLSVGRGGNDVVSESPSTGESGTTAAAPAKTTAERTAPAANTAAAAQPDSRGAQSTGAPNASCFDENNHATCPAEQMQSDVTKLDQALTQLNELFGGGRGRLQSNTNVRAIRETVLIMLQAQAFVTAEVGPFFAEFTGRYARVNPHYQNAEPSVGNRLRSFDHRADGNYEELRELLRQVATAGPESAGFCIQAVTVQLEHMDSVNPMLRGRVMNDLQTMIEVCPQYDPNNDEVRQQANAIRPQVTELIARYAAAELEAARGHSWEGNVASVSGGAPPALSNAGLRFLQGNDSWGGTEGTRVLAVSVRGDWNVARRNILGRPAQWGLPVHVAIVKETTTRQIAQVFEITLVTPGAQKQPRFQEAWVGNTWNVMRSALPRGARR